MSPRARIVILAVAIALVIGAGWYWWRARRIELYGGIKPFMRKLRSLEEGTASQLAKPGKLAEDFEQMEQLSQHAQDVFAVFRNDPREKDPKFGPLAAELVRRANMLEHDWDNGTREQASKSFAALVNACNACHQQLAEGKPPVISLEPKGQ